MPQLYRLVRPLLFKLDPELAHRLAFAVLRVAEFVLERTGTRAGAQDPALTQKLWGAAFPNPIGLAAGFDKNAELPHVWAALGFGFAELGTVTAQSQAGNPKPRLFRLTADQALINQMGFNNHGAAAIAAALRARLRRRPRIPLGLNLGKSRVTPLDRASDDYLASFRVLAPFADYVAVNISSPNTPGLRDLQSATQLEPLLAALQEENFLLAQTSGTPLRPLLIKVSPDLSEPDLHAVVSVAQRCHIAGLIATNTTTDRSSLRTRGRLATQEGGLSGMPLRQRSTEVIRLLHRTAGGRLPIIGVGGVFTPEDVYEKIRAGASLIQVYTGFVYEGPHLPRVLAVGLRRLLLRDGITNIHHAVGRDA